MADIADLGLAADRLSRRINFLEQRAALHLEPAGEDNSSQPHITDPKRTTHLACAGSLLRDAGATAMLLGDYAGAAKLLSEAGHLWARIGLFAGYLLLHIASPSPWWREREEDLELIGRAIRSRPGQTEVEDRPLLMSSASSLPQLLHLYQALRGSDIVVDSLRERLIDGRTTVVGITQTPLPAYLELLDDAADGNLVRSRETLQSMVLRRAEQLGVARADEYHWKMVLGPADIIDFDFLAVCLAATRYGASDLFAEIVGLRGPLVSLTFEVAQKLHDPSSADPGPGARMR